MSTYLEQLTIRLATGAAALPEALRRRHARYLRAAQQPDGGFAGRQGRSDLYYTGFGLRALALLGQLDDQTARRAAGFFQGRLTGRESIVDFLSLIYGAWLLRWAAGVDVFAGAPADWPDAVATALDQLRRPDGGYAKGPQGQASSTYHTFLVLLCLELVNMAPQEPEAIVRFLHSQRCEGGGFREIRASKRAGTNPTAAAIGALQILGALDEPTRQDTIAFLRQMQTDEGGLRANTRIPIADVLSTFTGLLTLADLGAADQIDLDRLKQFICSLELDQGGFLAAAWDEVADVEYTFYALGSLALLAPTAP